jgi:iron complex transport system substrate-binding protein
LEDDFVFQITSRRFTAFGIAAVALFAACGSSAKTASPPAATSTSAAPPTTTSAPPTTTPAPPTTTPAPPTTIADFPVTLKSSNGDVVIAAKPKAIISLSPSSTEDLFAIGAGDQVVAVDDQSTYPDGAKAKSTKLSGFTPNVEAIAGYKPDLVIVYSDSADGLVAALGKLDFTVLVEPAANTLDDVFTEIEQLGRATGHAGEAATLMSSMHARIDSIVKSAPKRATPVSYFHEVDNTLYTATSNTFTGSVYNLFGMRNVADAADTKKIGYPQLSQEVLISDNPQIIFLADAQYGESAATVKARPGWDAITAVKTGEIIETPADIASRWGPRIVDYVQVVADSLAKVPA